MNAQFHTLTVAIVYKPITDASCMSFEVSKYLDK